MKKTLLFTIAFLGAITLSSAQNSEAMVTDAIDTENFLVGTNKALNDPAIGAITAGTGTVSTNGAYIAISSDSNDPELDGTFVSTDDVQGTLTFTAKTTSANLNTNITLTLRKRKGNSVTGTVDVAGVQVETFSDLTDATTGNSLEYFNVVLTGVELTPTAKTITININSLLRESQTSAGLPTVRFSEISIEKTATLSVDEIHSVNSVSLYPNPVTNSFQITSNRTIQSVALYNITGRLTKTFNAASNYDISDLATGIYLAKIHTDLGSKTLRIVKK
ncbi:T9SS type A sorting domain-containing protein [Lacinutrix gracilariae]|uniref:T9SS type A sorting domain-containing protein n=1 Tax=Lacinutrix gracilariae TaxID=1747198 RepID=A0ABW5K241_9FLAO